MHAPYQALAVLSTGLYFAGLAYFKLAAPGMPPLRGDRPHRLAAALLGSRMWLTGAVVLGGGACVQVAALTGLTPAEAQPMFLAGVAVLLVVALPLLGERLTAREWGCVLLLAVAVLLFARGTEKEGDAAAIVPPEPVFVLAVVFPSLLAPSVLFLGVERPGKGVHARPLAGVALAVNAGLLTGTAELMLLGAADLGASPLALATSPYLYLFALTAVLALGQLQIALQRCRLVIVGLVATTTAKTYLLPMSAVLYGAPWPDARGVLALVLSVLAVAAVPHHEPATARTRADAVGGPA